jgi:hypothetical protein
MEVYAKMTKVPRLLLVGVMTFAISSSRQVLLVNAHKSSAFVVPVHNYSRVMVRKQHHRLLLVMENSNKRDILNAPDDMSEDDDDEDTVRVRIWRALATGQELSLKQLGAAVGQHRDLLSHLKHVEKQAMTLKNKNAEWRERRGLPTENVPKVNKWRLKQRRKKKELFLRLE